jgi:hypothetical protein
MEIFRCRSYIQHKEKGKCSDAIRTFNTIERWNRCATFNHSTTGYRGRGAVGAGVAAADDNYLLAADVDERAVVLERPVLVAGEGLAERDCVLYI